MNKDLQNMLCSCGNVGHIGGASNRYISQKDDFFYDEDDNDVDCPRYESSDRDEKLLNDWKVLDDDSWDVISSLRQKFCQLAKSETEGTAAKESPHSSYTYSNRQPFESQSFVERASHLIDYTPESEFLKKIKQQCQYLQNRLPNIFSALNECFPDSGSHECERRCSEWTEHREKTYSGERLNVNDKKSEHVSRSKKPVKRRKIRKRKSNTSEKCESENEFEPTLKKPNENSCDRCWRFASPARSPVNKPDQRYDPNFRRAHSTTNFEKGDGNLLNCAETPSADSPPNIAPNTAREFPCARHMPEASSRRSPPSVSAPFNNREVIEPGPHICIRQKAEIAPPIQHFCRKHKCSMELPEFPPPPTLHLCPKHKCSLQQSPPPMVTQHLCSKLRFSTQQPESTHLCPKHNCSVSTQEPPPLRHPSTTPGHSPFSKVKELKYSPGGPAVKKHQCKQPLDDLNSVGILSSNSGRKPRPPSYTSGLTPKERRRSPNAIDELNQTEYKDICIKPKKQSPVHAGDPCNKVESAKASTSNECRGFPKSSSPPRSVRQCDQSRLESIPEAETSSKMRSSRQEGADNGKGRLSNGHISGKNGSAGFDSTIYAEAEVKGAKSEKSASGLSKKDKSEKSPTGGASKKNKSEKSSTGGRSKKGKSESSPNSKSKRENLKSSKKSPDKSKALNGKSQSNLRDKSQVMHSCGKKSTQFDKAHPVRYCKCVPRIPETEIVSEYQAGHVLCCHCDWKENARKSKTSPQTNDDRKFPSRGRPENGNNTGTCVCGSNSPPPKSASPENNSPRAAKGAPMECPYRAYMNRYGASRDHANYRSGAQEETHQLCRERQNETSCHDRAFLESSPRKYFVYYMTKAKEKNENDVEVLVEELAQGCPDEAASRNKDITKKMKKISEHPPDSMALRFQKGVSEACNVPQNSRILYF